MVSLSPTLGQRLIDVHLYFLSANVELLLGIEQIGHGPSPMVLILEREEIDN